MMLNLETIVWARTGVSDMLLTGAWEGLCCPFSGVPSRQNQQYKRVVSCFLCTNCLGCLKQKGPVGIVLPALIIGFCFTSVTRWKLREMRVLLGGLLFWRSRCLGMSQ